MYSSVDGQLGCFHILSFVNNAMNIAMHEYFQITGFIFSGDIPRRRISGSYSRSIFSFLRILHTIFLSGCTSYIHTNGSKIPFSSQSHEICYL